VPRGDLEDVADASAREQDSPRTHRHDPDHEPSPIEQDRVDREPHAEGVDGPASVEEETAAGAQRRSAPEPAYPLAPGLGQVDLVATERRAPHAAP
jgi:hypothetical protein